MRMWLPAVTALLGFLLPVAAPAQTDPALREDGVLYFEDNLPAPITATAATGTTLYLHRDFQMALASIYTGQNLELVGMSPEGFLVKTTARNNTITGWIRAENLPPGIDTHLFAEAQANQARHDRMTAAIAQHQVLQGMTADEVTLAMGRPDQVASREDAKSSSVSWSYITYALQPQTTWGYDYFGRRVLQTYDVKVPVGKLTVNFNDGLVASIENRQTTGPGVAAATN